MHRDALGLIAVVLLLGSACGRVGPTAGQASATRTASSPSVVATSPSCGVPAARGNSALVYDSNRQTLVLFGGSGREVYGDTWLRSGPCWQQINPTTSPPARSTAAAAFDPNAQVVLMF